MNELSGLVRILNQKMVTIGAGYIASQNGLIVTCAHVIKEAGYPSVKIVNIKIEDSDLMLMAKVEEKYWIESEKSDVAFLRVTSKEFTPPFPASISSSKWIVDKDAQVFGFPFIDGYSVDRMAVKVLGMVKNKNGENRLRLETVETLMKKNPVPGMSGGPILVVQDQQNIFVGMFIEFYEGTNRAWAVPIERILELCPELTPLLPEDIDAYIKAVLQFCREIPTVGTKAIFLNDIYVRQNLVYGKSETTAKISENIPVYNAILKFAKIVIIGIAGSGKSTLLRHITDRFARERVDGKPILPILISAKGLAEKTSSFEKALREQIESELGVLLPSEMPNGFLREWQRKVGGKWLILLDGIDEIRDPFQKKRFMDNLAQYPWPTDSIVVITSRPDPSLVFPSEYQILEMAPFGKKQAEEFIDLWFGDDVEKILGLKKKLKADLKILSETPLLLTLASQVFENLNSLPSHRIDVYSYFINLLLDVRSLADLDSSGENWALRQTHILLNQQFPNAGEKIYDGRKDLFERIALGYYEYQDIYKIVRETFNLATASEAQGVLQIFSSQRIGLLTKRVQYEFIHSTFRDFLAAQRLVNVFRKDPAQIWEWLENKWDDSLRGVALFALALLKKHDISIQFILNKKTQDLEGLLFLSEYISITGDVDDFGKKVIKLLYKSAKATTRVEYLLGESAIEGIRNLSHYPDVAETLCKLIDDTKVTILVRQEALRILATISDISVIRKYIINKDTYLAREGVRILSELGEFDSLVELSQDKSLDFLVTLEILDSCIKFEQWDKIIFAIPKKGKIDTWVNHVAEELFNREETSFFEEFMLWVGQSHNTSPSIKEDILLRLFSSYLKQSNNIRSIIVIGLLKNTQHINVCIKLFDLFILQAGHHHIAEVLIALMYDVSFSKKAIRQKITEKLNNSDFPELVTKYNLLNDFLGYFLAT